VNQDEHDFRREIRHARGSPTVPKLQSVTAAWRDRICISGLIDAFSQDTNY